MRDSNHNYRLYARIFGVVFLYCAIVLLGSALDSARTLVRDIRSYEWLPIQAVVVDTKNDTTGKSTPMGLQTLLRSAVFYEYTVAERKIVSHLAYTRELRSPDEHKIGKLETVYYDPSSPENLRGEIGIHLLPPFAFLILAFISALLLYAAFALLTRETPEEEVQKENYRWRKIGVLWGVLTLGLLPFCS